MNTETTDAGAGRPPAFETSSGPFPGLRPYEPHEAPSFFGRKAEVGELIKRLRRTRFISVVGASGSGKSSLVRAGLLPALRGGQFIADGRRWRVATCRPGDDPVGNLARALSSPSVSGGGEFDEPTRAAFAEAVLRQSSLGLIKHTREARLPPRCNLLVVVERFGDLFRLAPAMESEGRGEESAVFVRLLLEAARQSEVPIYVIVLLRASYFGHCARFSGLPECINDGTYLIPRLTRDEAGEVIAGPPRAFGAEVAPRLVQRLLNDLSGAPLRLPTFQHALMRTWEVWRREDDACGPVDLRHYESAGGMGGALSRHAEEAFDELADAESQALAGRLFGALARGCRGGEHSAIIKLKTLCETLGAREPDVVALIEVFRREGGSFLMPPATLPLTAESLVEISYDDLIHSWARLKAWAGGAG